MIVTQKHLFNKDGNRTTKYIKVPLTKEIKKQRLYHWLKGNIDIGRKEIDFGEVQEFDAYADTEEIVLANWNDLPDKLPDYIEDLGIEIGWNDAYTSCECGKFIQIQPDSYSWSPNFLVVNDYKFICRECIESDITLITDSEYQDNHFINNDNIALPYWIVELIEKEGFILYEDSFESGFFPGQNDTPEKVIEALNIDIDLYERLWVIDGRGQFDINFSLYLRKKNNEN